MTLTSISHFVCRDGLRLRVIETIAYLVATALEIVAAPKDKFKNA